MSVSVNAPLPCASVIDGSEQEEPPAKRAKMDETQETAGKSSAAHFQEEPMLMSLKVEPDPWRESFESQTAAAVLEHRREDLLDALFEAWDRDGNGCLSFEEVLPHYMKCAHHHNLLEPEVRSAFEHFMSSKGKSLKEGITLEMFHMWFSGLSDEQVAAHFVRNVQGWSRLPYKMNIGHTVVKGFKQKTLKEILDSPVHALWGLSELADDALAPLGLYTVRDVGGWRCFLIARAICALAAKEIPGSEYRSLDDHKHMNIRNALQETYANATLKHVMHLPVSALSMFPEKGEAALELINIRTIQHLGKRKYFIWANAMLELEKFEAECRQP